jgi:hypothetical protein
MREGNGEMNMIRVHYLYIYVWKCYNDTHYFVQFLFWWDWSLNLKLCACKAGVLPLDPHLKSIFSGYFGDEVSQTISLRWPQTLILYHPDLSLLSSLNYRHKSMWPIEYVQNNAGPIQTWPLNSLFILLFSFCKSLAGHILNMMKLQGNIKISR